MTEQSTTTAPGRSEEEVRAYVAEIILELAPTPGQAAADGGARLVEDLGFHSLALLELAFTLEDEFDLQPIDEETARRITTIEAVGGHVVSSLRERGALAG
ncbi:phosphopantetheine-binding protein [Nonomuraea sp. NPDC046802]|uniref:acyl carrier protein n=1 Tax=Nonomuraea sp. NPDC046802 TaxID=3154919 RepID=UPI0033FA49BC